MDRHTLRAIGFLALLWALPACAAAPRAASAPQAGNGLAGEIESLLQHRILQRAEVGIEVLALSPGNGRSIYARNNHAPLIPASNMKIMTASAALDRLGVDFRFRTQLVLRGADVILVGDGDPALGDSELLKKAGWEVTTVFRNWAELLRKRGVTTVGDVLVDDSVFDQAALHPQWPADQQDKRYVPQVTGVSLNANCLDFYIHPARRGEPVRFVTVPATHYATIRNACTGGPEMTVWPQRQLGTNQITLRGTCPYANEKPVSVTIHDPSLFAATVLAETLAAAGIKVTGQVARDRTIRGRLADARSAAGLTVVAVHDTPLTAVLVRACKDSMNLYAESLWKRIGHAHSGKPGSWETGAAAAGDLLKRLGVPDREYRLSDGCGLSRENAISSNAIGRLLVHNFSAKHSQAFMDCLAVGGQDGTLEKRFESANLRGRVFAKTGFINSVSALSGYLKARNDQWYAFSILMNGIPRGTNSEAKAIQEGIVRAIEHNASGRGR